MNMQANGATSFFDWKDHCIRVSTSFTSGKEAIYIDEQLVSEKRSLGYRSEHQFELDGHPLRVKIRIGSIWRGPVIIELFADGKLIDSDEWDLKRIMAHQKQLRAQQPWWKPLTSSFIGGVFGVIVGYAIASWLLG